MDDMMRKLVFNNYLLAFDGLLLEGGGFFEIGLSSLEDGFRDRG
jgi:hypothetical protein